MVKEKVYLETSVISYLTARPPTDVIKLAKHKLTRLWWDKHSSAYDLYVSTPVRDESRKGDIAWAIKSATRTIQILY